MKKKVLISAILISLCIMSILMVKAIDTGGAWDKRSGAEWIIEREYYDDEDPFRFIIEPDNDDEGDNWGYEVRVDDEWKWDEVDFNSGEFIFTIDQDWVWLSGQSCSIQIKDPDDIEWTTLASDPYGSDPADASITKTRQWLKNNYGKHIGGYWYQIQIKFRGFIYIIPTGNTYISNFYVLFFYS